MSDILTRLELATRRTHDPDMAEAVEYIKGLLSRIAEMEAERAADLAVVLHNTGEDIDCVSRRAWASLADLDWRDRMGR